MLVTIPTVVHVVHNKPREDIDESQIRSQVAALNKDFRATNPDVSKVPAPWRGLVADPKIEFQLATKDPLGKRTSGIVRRRTDRGSFAAGDAVKRATDGSVAWPSDRYLNIWVCTLDGGLLGYAQFPGGPKATDGVVILNTAFGTEGTVKAPFDRGRTLTGSTSVTSGATPSTAAAATASRTHRTAGGPTPASRPSPRSAAATGRTATCT
jgi:hypothetical protein